MTDTKKRTIQDIQVEYQNLCLKAGHLQYQAYTNNRDLEMVNQELRDLNLEAATMNAANAKEKAEAAAAASAPDNVTSITSGAQ